MKKKNVLIVTSVLLVVIGAISWFILSDKKAETDSDTKVTTTEINAAVTQNITEKETLPEVTETETEPETLSEPEHEIGFEHETTPIEMSDEALKVLGDDSEKAKEMITEIVISYYYDSVEKVKLLAVKPSEKNADEMILSYKAVREVDRYFDIIYNTKTKKIKIRFMVRSILSMFTKLRQMYYKHQDEKVYKKYVEPEKKQNRNKIGSNQDKKGIFILIAVFSSFIAVILIAIILKHTLIKKSSDTGEETKAVNTTYAVETESETTTFLEETITEESTVEETVTEETISETVTTVKKKKKKYKVKTTEAVTTRKYNISVPNKPEIPVVTTKPTETEKKVNNKFPTQKEDNSILSKNNMNLIRNSIISAADGTYNDNLQNLAIYMANKGLKNAQSAVSEILDNSTLKVTSKTATVTIYSTDSEEVLQAAEELAEMLCGTYNTYGVGIKASYRSGKYNIYVVVAALR